MTSDDIPAEALAMLQRLWPLQQPITFQLRPRDAWTVLAIVQFAWRNPQLSPQQRRLMETFGRQLQAAIVAIEPEAAPYLDMGWHPEYDVPRGHPDDDPGQRVAPL